MCQPSSSPEQTQNTDTKVCVIGVGFVGEHLVDVFSKRYKVYGYDVSPQRVKAMKERFAENKNVIIQNSQDNLDECSLYLISVPTLLTKTHEIDTSYIKSAVDIVEKYAKTGATVVMESSVSVGMTKMFLSSLRDKGIYVGFSPERVDPGRTEPPVEQIAKIVSGIDEESLQQVYRYYSNVFKNIHKVSSMETAEMCKLYENCFRMVNIAYANEVADVCKSHQIDVYEMVNACSTKPFGFMPFYPSLGVGGHCIPVNPFYLFTNCNLPLLKHATDITLTRPQMKAVEFTGYNNILVVGVAFKPGESYTMNSPGLAFATELAKLGKNVTIFDPLVSCDLSNNMNMLPPSSWNKETLESYDAIVVTIKQVDVDMSVLGHIDKSKSQVFQFCN